MNGSNTYQNTPKWFGDRLFHFTSSELHKLLMKPKSGAISKVAESYIFDKLAEELTNGTCIDYNELNTREVRWGHTYEPEARTEYELRTGYTVKLCGFFEWSHTFGGSPDGLVEEDGIIEIKCPYNSAVHAKYLLLETASELHRIKPEYYAQIQGNLLATGRKWCDFISFDPRCQNKIFALKILKVNRNEEFIDEIREALDNAERIKDQITNKIVRLCMN